jgi:type I restriction enzyme S subunit
MQTVSGVGGSLLRARPAFVAGISVPLPPLEEQRRIAAILDQAETLRTQRRQALAHLDTLTQSLFLDMFGDPRKNPKLWPTAGVESVCELIVDCVNRTAPIVEEQTPYKMIRTTNVKAGKVDLSSVRYVTADTFKVWNRRATPIVGDVLLTREAPLGEAGILDRNDRVFLGQRLMLYRPAKAHLVSEYLLHSFLSPFLQDQFERHGSGSTVKHLPLPACRAFELRMPPLPLQQTFATRIQAIEALKATHRTALAQLDALFASLQQRAFSGELTRPASAAVPTCTKPDLSTLCKLDVKKMLEALIYVAKRMPGHDFYKSLKALYAGDRQHLEHHGYLIYGETYEALEHGPVPKAAYALTKTLEDAAASNLFADDPMSIPLQRIGNQLIPARDADFGLLSAAERKSLDWAIKYYGPMNFGDTKTVSHDSAYLATALNTPIAIEDIIRSLPEAAQRRFFG